MSDYRLGRVSMFILACFLSSACLDSVWQCERPHNLSCDYWVYHKHGEHQFPATAFERQLFSSQLANVGIAGEKHIINVLPNAAGIGEPERCRRGLSTPVPAGFYFQDVWKSFVCNTRQFDSQQRTSCLSNKIVYFLGDSTTRQYLDFFKEMCRMDYGNQWYGMQFNTVMREMFSDIDHVFYMDVWQMTSCHYTPVDLHPSNVINSNEIDMILTFLCPS